MWKGARWRAECSCGITCGTFPANHTSVIRRGNGAVILIGEPCSRLRAAQPQIKPKGISKKKRTIGVIEFRYSKKKRTIGVIEFRYFTEVEGRFAHLLPKKEGDVPPSILH